MAITGFGAVAPWIIGVVAFATGGSFASVGQLLVSTLAPVLFTVILAWVRYRNYVAFGSDGMVAVSAGVKKDAVAVSFEIPRNPSPWAEHVKCVTSGGTTRLPMLSQGLYRTPRALYDFHAELQKQGVEWRWS